MRFFIIISTLLFLSLWILSSLYYIGVIEIPFLTLKLPNSTAELGDSMGLLNGLFSSITVVLALIAIIYQNKELRDSTKAQDEQAIALNEQALALNKQLLQQQKYSEIQLEKQQISNKIIALAARQKFIISEANRLSKTIIELHGSFEQKELFNNCVYKKSRLREEANKIDEDMKFLLRMA